MNNRHHEPPASRRCVQPCRCRWWIPARWSASGCRHRRCPRRGAAAWRPIALPMLAGSLPFTMPCFTHRCRPRRHRPAGMLRMTMAPPPPHHPLQSTRGLARPHARPSPANIRQAAACGALWSAPSDRNHTCKHHVSMPAVLTFPRFRQPPCTHGSAAAPYVQPLRYAYQFLTEMDNGSNAEI